MSAHSKFWQVFVVLIALAANLVVGGGARADIVLCLGDGHVAVERSATKAYSPGNNLGIDQAARHHIAPCIDVPQQDEFQSSQIHKDPRGIIPAPLPSFLLPSSIPLVAPNVSFAPIFDRWNVGLRSGSRDFAETVRLLI